VIQPLATGAIGWPDLMTMTLISLLMVIFLFTRNVLSRIEGVVLFTGYVSYTTWLVAF
jgi:Ca2+/Na+ antiporter